MLVKEAPGDENGIVQEQCVNTMVNYVLAP